MFFADGFSMQSILLFKSYLALYLHIQIGAILAISLINLSNFTNFGTILARARGDPD